MLKSLLQTATALGMSATLLSAATTRPNVLFIVADDVRADTIHALGNAHVRTPNIDKLIQHGATFTQVYNMGSTAPDVGASSRAVMLSGRSLFRFSGDISDSTDDMPLLPEVLRKSGFATFGTGQWKNGRRWFERSFSHGDEIMFCDDPEAGNMVGFEFDKSGEYPATSSHRMKGRLNERVAAATVAFLENRPRGKPFFAYVGFTASDDPHKLPNEFRSMYSGARLPLPENFMSQRPLDTEEPDAAVNQPLLASQLRDRTLEQLIDYYGMISHLDAQIGVILDALETTSVKENTIIVFTSDNGIAVDSHGLTTDRSLYEHSVRVPLILSGPGVPRNKSYISMCYLMDVYPTIGEMVGAKVPASVEGKSLRPILTVQASEIRNTLYAAYEDTQRSIRDYRWKLMFYPQIDRYQLFNLRNDPDEKNDLFPSGEHGRDINRLRIQLSAWQSSLDDPLR